MPRNFRMLSRVDEAMTTHIARPTYCVIHTSTRWHDRGSEPTIMSNLSVTEKCWESIAVSHTCKCRNAGDSWLIIGNVHFQKRLPSESQDIFPYAILPRAMDPKNAMFPMRCSLLTQNHTALCPPPTEETRPCGMRIRASASRTPCASAGGSP